MTLRNRRGYTPGPLAWILLIEDGRARLRRWRRRRHDAKALAQVRQAAEEDTTLLGEDIAALDLDVADPNLDDATRQDYAQALDSYESATKLLALAERPVDLRGVTMSLEEGRFAMTRARARLQDEPVPARRSPCFFNPQHGPSITDMEWTPEGGVPREVPVCDIDAARLADHEEPQIRYVLVGGKLRPYWEAGPEYSHWCHGYYGPLAPVVLAGTGLGAVYVDEYTAGADAPGDDMGGDFGGNSGGFDGDVGADADAGADAGG